MFTLKKSTTVWWPVTINEPADNGLTTEHQCHIQFDLVTQKTFDELAQQGDIVLLNRVIKGWRDILATDGSELPFLKKYTEAFYQMPFVRAALITGYLHAASGAPAKN